MTNIPAHFQLNTSPVARPGATITAPQVRFTLLTARLIRLEYVPAGAAFTNQASQAFWFRDQPEPDFQVSYGNDGAIDVTTHYLALRYRPGHTPGFRPDSLSIHIHATNTTWHYGDPDHGNLRGTTRTLDQVSGHTLLEPGLLSRQGWVVVDDSHSLLFNDTGWLEPRPTPAGALDLYFFGYGHDYQQCLHDYTLVTGPVPMLPRWALGNWWSRYWAYTQEELMNLMRDFRRHEVPLSVCIIDMDWHTTETGNSSRGWTGYTWNNELFPNPGRFINWLHRQGLKTALNLHPADGVHPHEAQYNAMCQAMGQDPAGGQPIPFNIADPQFAHAYFTLLHHPREAEGVDFWWTDWQQGGQTTLPGLDPLWWLNHLHFYDLGRDGHKRPFIFSRWGGLGNHRYPIGFSGDTFVNWETLAFQPYFTASAANVAYGWWSHDIGGHMFGIEDSELYTRWVQFGLCSPILRLHSTKNAYHERRPWGFDRETFRVTRQAMQLRHALIPYLYTLAWQNHTSGIAPIRPMYHDYPNAPEAYHCPHQYTFGPDLLAAPFTTPRDPDTRLSRQVVWLPAIPPAGDDPTADNHWIHAFTGRSYAGGHWHAIYGTLHDIPVFARPGAIIPLSTLRGWGGVENPAEMTIVIFPGADNQFNLYEDDGETTAYQQGAYALTPFSQQWQPGELQFDIRPATGDLTHLPNRRRYTLLFRGIHEPTEVRVLVDGLSRPVNILYDEPTYTLQLELDDLRAGQHLSITLKDEKLLARHDPRPDLCRDMLHAFRLETGTKAAIADRLSDILADPRLLNDYAIPLAPAHTRALLETILQAGITHIKNAGPEERLVLWNSQQHPAVTYRLNAFTELRWQTDRHYQPEQGRVPTVHILPLAQLNAYHRWQLTFNYGDILSLPYDGVSE